MVLEPVDLSLARMKNISANWLLEMWEYIVDNPQFVVNGFIRSGICCALDGVISDNELDDLIQLQIPVPPAHQMMNKVTIAVKMQYLMMKSYWTTCV